MATSHPKPGAEHRQAKHEVVVGGRVSAEVPQVSLVVSTVGRPEAIGRLIESLLTESADGPSIELIVVDQSADGVALEALEQPALAGDDAPFSWLYTRSPIGVSRGRNIGLGMATGELVMFPDDDAWFPGRTLARSVEHFNQHPEHDGLCTQLRDAHDRLSMLRWAPTARLVTKRNHHRTSIGSTMLFRAEAAREAVGFDEAIGPGAGGWFGSCEDADFLLRVIERGATVWYDPTVVMHHRDSRRDGGADAQYKALAYGCGQGHMWRSHRFSLTLIITLLLRRFFGGGLWSLRGRGDIGRAHRAWVRGAINGWFDRPPSDLLPATTEPAVVPATGSVLEGAPPNGAGVEGAPVNGTVVQGALIGGVTVAGPPVDGVVGRPNAPSSGEFRRSFVRRILVAPVGTVATFALTAIAARTLGSAELTIFYALLAALTIGPILGRFGLNQRAVRDLAAARTRDDLEVAASLARRHVRSALLPQLVAAPVISVLFIAGAASGGIDVGLAVLATIVLAAESCRLTVSDVLTGLGLTGWAALFAHQVRAACVTVAAGLVVVAAPDSLDLRALVEIMAAVTVALAVAGLVRLWAIPQRPYDGELETRIGPLLRLGLPFLMVDLVVVVVARGDVWLAARALPAATAALYSTASTLAVQIGTPIGLASVAVAPVVAGYVAQGRFDELESMVRSLSTAVVYLVVPVFIGFVVFGDDLLGLAYGEGFRGAHPYLVTLMVGNLTLATLGVSSIILLMANRHRLAMTLAGTWFAMAAPLVIVTTLVSGPLGLAVASASTTVGLYGILAAAVWVTTGIPLLPYRDIRRVTVPGRVPAVQPSSERSVTA